MLFYKLRSLGLEVSTNPNKRITIEQIVNTITTNKSVLTKLEHNRWNTEKLILGFRPLLNDDEIQEWTKDKESMKKQLKHHDIMPFYLLNKEEQDKDDDVNTHLHLLYEKASKDINYDY